MAQANEGEATRLLESRGALLAATGNLGKLLRLETGTVATGWFESPVHDSSTVARWGKLAWRGDVKGIAFKTRSGNSLRPDATWSDWSEPLTDPDRAAIASPNARYIQWRAEFSGTAGSAPALDSVTIAYLPQNTPPNVRSINVTAVSGSAKSGPAARRRRQPRATRSRLPIRAMLQPPPARLRRRFRASPGSRCRSTGRRTIRTGTA